MRNAARRFRYVPVAMFLSVAFLVSSPSAESKEGPKPTRSIYLPIEFALCEHLRDGVLYQGEQALGLLPAKRIFQFTYYPGLERIEPVRTDVRVEGLRRDGEDFVGKLAITPWGIFTAHNKVELDIREQLDRLRYKLDVRYETRTLTLRCSDTCSRKIRFRSSTPRRPPFPTSADVPAFMVYNI